MDPSSSSNPAIKKQDDDDKIEKRDIKPVPKTLNRVPRELHTFFLNPMFIAVLIFFGQVLVSENFTFSKIITLT